PTASQAPSPVLQRLGHRRVGARAHRIRRWRTAKHVVARVGVDGNSRLPKGPRAALAAPMAAVSWPPSIGRTSMAAIDHVVVLALENRSFDHMLGALDHPNPAFDGLGHGGPYTNPGWNGDAVAAAVGAKAVLPVGPDHAHDGVMQQLGIASDRPPWHPTNTGFVSSYDRTCRNLRSPRYRGLLGPVANWWDARKQASRAPVTGRGPLIMLSQAVANVPVLSRLAVEFAVCTRWFCSVPGETWPNRNFLHATTSDGETDIDVRFYDNRTIFDVLEAAGHSWRIYYDDTPQVWAFSHLWDTDERRANWFEFSEFAAHA